MLAKRIHRQRSPLLSGLEATHDIRQEENTISDPRTNDRIRVSEVRLVGPAGEQLGVVAIDVALRLAAEADLDLVEVAPNSAPPVAKIMDYGKFKYEAAQKLKEARRNQANTILKEVRFRLKIDEHDYDTKRRHAISFLSAGDKVKAMILFRGREQSRPEQGVRLLQRFAEDVAEFGSVESTPTVDGRNMVMVIGPLRSKSDARAEQLAKRDAAKAEAKAARVESSSSPAKSSVAEKPVVEKPAAAPVEAPVVEAPVVEAPAVETPAAEAPVAEKPAKAPAAKAAAPKATAAKAPAAKKPASASADSKVAVSKAADKPATEKKPAAAKAPAAKAPAAPKTTKPAAAKAAPKPSADAE